MARSYQRINEDDPNFAESLDLPSLFRRKDKYEEILKLLANCPCWSTDNSSYEAGHGDATFDDIDGEWGNSWKSWMKSLKFCSDNSLPAPHPTKYKEGYLAFGIECGLTMTAD